MSQQVREDVLRLMHRKDRIEDEIRELSSILTKNGIGMTDPLVDAEGFPLNHIDIYQVRHARHRIICLQNDHKALMKQIENGLQGYYNSEDSGNSFVQDIAAEIERPVNVVHKTPFAKVTLVNPGSPADYAGMQVNDLIVEFGSINSTNFRKIGDIAAVVQHSEGQHLRIKLKRGDRFIVAQLLPKKWSGLGLMGCSIVAVDV